MKIIPLFFLLCLAIPARSQQKDAFYMLDADWKPTPNKDSARYFIRVKEISDTCWQWDYYNLIGPLMRSEQYRDKDANDQHGVSYYYDHTGRLDSTTRFRHGKKNGDSYKYTGDSLRMKFKYVYQDDSLIEFVDVQGQRKGPQKVDSVEQESEYPGGISKWMRYLNKNLKYPDRAINAEVQGDVRVLFIVDKDGMVVQPIIGHSVEYSLDDEALRIIGQSGSWTPAVQFGRHVKSYKLQPVYFRLK
jgi:protein TonB